MVVLAEDLYLLACDEDTGRLLIDPAHLDLGLGGALLLDLVSRRRVALVDGRVAVVDRAPTGDPLLDGALAKIEAEATPQEPDHVVRHLARGARAAVRERLIAAGVLRRADHKILGVVPVHLTPEADDRIERALHEHLQDAVVLDHPPSVETAAVSSLALALGLHRHLFPRADRRAVERRMQEIADAYEGRWVAAAVKQAADAVDAALGIVRTAT